MQTKFSLEITNDFCTLIFRENPPNIILFIDGTKQDVSCGQKCMNQTFICDINFDFNVFFFFLIFIFDSFIESRTKIEDDAAEYWNSRFMPVATRRD